MSDKQDDGGPAFPQVASSEVHFDADENPITDYVIYPGMSLRVYAAIKLRVPNSGLDWLDAMIRESQ